MRKWLILLVSTLVIGFLVLYFSQESYFLPYPEIDTNFSSQFTHEKFDSIKPGTSKSQIHELLGEPLITNLGIDCETYSSDGKLKILDFAWLAYEVCYGKEDLVRETAVNIFEN